MPDPKQQKDDLDRYAERLPEVLTPEDEQAKRFQAWRESAPSRAAGEAARTIPNLMPPIGEGEMDRFIEDVTGGRVSPAGIREGLAAKGREMRGVDAAAAGTGRVAAINPITTSDTYRRGALTDAEREAAALARDNVRATWGAAQQAEASRGLDLLKKQAPHIAAEAERMLAAREVSSLPVAIEAAANAALERYEGIAAQPPYGMVTKGVMPGSTAHTGDLVPKGVSYGSGTQEHGMSMGGITPPVRGDRPPIPHYTDPNYGFTPPERTEKLLTMSTEELDRIAADSTVSPAEREFARYIANSRSGTFGGADTYRTHTGKGPLPGTTAQTGDLRPRGVSYEGDVPYGRPHSQRATSSTMSDDAWAAALDIEQAQAAAKEMSSRTARGALGDSRMQAFMRVVSELRDDPAVRAKADALVKAGKVARRELALDIAVEEEIARRGIEPWTVAPTRQGASLANVGRGIPGGLAEAGFAAFVPSIMGVQQIGRTQELGPQLEFLATQHARPLKLRDVNEETISMLRADRATLDDLHGKGVVSDELYRIASGEGAERYVR